MDIAQRRIRHGEHAGRFGDGDVGDRGHAGQELGVGVLDRKHGGVAYQPVFFGRGVAHLGDGRGEDHAVIGFDGEGGVVALGNLADVGFGDRGEELHLGQVLGDGEQGRRRERGGDDLAGFGGDVEHHAVDRREDDRLVELGRLGIVIGLGEVEIGVGHEIGRIGALPGGVGGLVDRVDDQPAVIEARLGVERVFGLFERGLGREHLGRGGGEVGALHRQLGFELGGVEAGEGLALGDRVVEVHEHLGEGARQFRRDVDHALRLDRAGGGYGDGEVAAGDSVGAVARLSFGGREAGAESDPAGEPRGRDQNRERGPAPPVTFPRTYGERGLDFGSAVFHAPLHSSFRPLSGRIVRCTCGLGTSVAGRRRNRGEPAAEAGPAPVNRWAVRAGRPRRSSGCDPTPCAGRHAGPAGGCAADRPRRA